MNAATHHKGRRCVISALHTHRRMNEVAHLRYREENRMMVAVAVIIRKMAAGMKIWRRAGGQ